MLLYPIHIKFFIIVIIVSIFFTNVYVECITSSDQLIWKQIGSNIIGKSNGDEFGYSLDMSSDGMTIVVGVPFSDVNGSTDSGAVYAYSYNVTSNSFVQIGPDIVYDGTIIPFANFGYSVAISGDGTTIVIGAPYATSNGVVTVHRFNSISQSWIKLGTNINGKGLGDAFGTSVAMSADGNIIAIGAPLNDSNGRNSGHVRVYSYSAGSSFGWKQVGNDINGNAIDDLSGYSVSLSSDGNSISIGAPYHDGNVIDSGQVRVYSYNSGSSIGWKQIGSDIYGNAPNVRSGWSTTISSDGTTIAIGAPFNANDNTNAFGHVNVYSIDSTGNKWIQLNSNINGEANGDFSSSVVAMSGDGKTLVVGAPFNDGNGTDSGEVRVYNINSTSGSLVQIGMDVNGESINSWAGWAVAVSTDGTTIAIGSPTITGYGDVRVFKSDRIMTSAPIANPTKSMAPTNSPVLSPVLMDAPSTTTTDKNCGVFGLNFFCPRRGECGFFKRLIHIGSC